MKASRYFREKPVNYVNQRWLPDGTVEISIYKEGWKKSYKFKVKHFGTEKEEILKDEEIKEEKEEKRGERLKLG